MITQAVTAPVDARPGPGQVDVDLLDPLWRLAGDLSVTRVLVVAEHGVDLICGLLRLGCPRATLLRPFGKPDTGACETIIIPRIAEIASVDAAIRLARRSLGGDGRLIAGVRSGATIALIRRLRLNGFSGIRSIDVAGLTLLRADLRRAP